MTLCSYFQIDHISIDLFVLVTLLNGPEKLKKGMICLRGMNAFFDKGLIL